MRITIETAETPGTRTFPNGELLINVKKEYFSEIKERVIKMFEPEDYEPDDEISVPTEPLEDDDERWDEDEPDTIEFLK